ncbi:two-component system phosphate regulon sensor histidine kinase PhoR [Azonexus fungiphilus]|uniref:Phosphate regulon sensor protein PhoR n=1 Tax=Azonexus fungiphilus TaxID=146940 RepID=A0A495WNR2_9RHOO|nr:phosphate regulon sensor histidine kinase PhoR [Azonexus fungiphilus]RKT62385.1 two-component system phosphate regulon sensor histidine kinase PhoR [Azonexus fungiphilus]
MQRALAYGAFTAVIAFLLGYFGETWMGWVLFYIGLSVHLAMHYRNFSRLERWSHKPVLDASLEGDGEWDAVFRRLYRHEKELLEKIEHRERDIARLIAAVHAMNDGIVLLDGEFRIQFCNKTAERQLDIDSSTDRGAAIANIVRQPRFIDYLGKGDFTRPLVLRLDRYFERVLSLYLIAYAEDHWLLQVKDITQTDRLDSMRRDFVANVSHELRTPLTVLSGFVETLQEIELDADSRRHYLQLMGEQSQRMQSIVQDLLTLSSIESAPPPEDQPVDMASLVDKLYRDAVALSAGRHDIRLDSDGQGDLLGAESELVSALANLVANAVRYTPAGGTITLIWKISAEGAEFAVQDTGIGIDPKHIPRLTERFYRVDRGRSRDAGGTGLGLAIVKHSLNRHQATLEITSKPGEGSRFATRFPASRVTGL